MSDNRFAYRVLVGKPEAKEPLERPRQRWESNNKIYMKGIGWVCVDWIDLAEDRDKL
jgi:hypothetical protein